MENTIQFSNLCTRISEFPCCVRENWWAVLVDRYLYSTHLCTTWTGEGIVTVGGWEPKGNGNSTSEH